MEWLTKLIGGAVDGIGNIGTGLANFFTGGSAVDPSVLSESLIDSTNYLPEVGSSLTKATIGDSSVALPELLSTNYTNSGLASSFSKAGMPYVASSNNYLTGNIAPSIADKAYSITAPSTASELFGGVKDIGKDAMSFFKDNKDGLAAIGDFGKLGYGMYSGNKAAKMTQGVIDRRNAESDKAAAERESFMAANNTAWKKFNEQEAQKTQVR